MFVMKLHLDRLPRGLSEYAEAIGACMRAFDHVAHVREIRLFGSFARQEARGDSDVDLCIVADGADRQLDTARRFRAAIRSIRPKPPLTLVPISPERLAEKRHRGDHFFKTVFDEGVAIASED